MEKGSFVIQSPSESFKILVNQPALAVCPYSYTDHKSFQKKVRVFSLGGLTALVGATIISTLLLNPSTGPIFQSKAATYTWNQANWTDGADTENPFTHTQNQAGTEWKKYYSKDSSLAVVNNGADLQLSTTSSQTTQTSDTDWNTGTLSSTAVSGTGDTADIVLSKAAHINEYTIGTKSTNVDATAVTDNSNGTWTITLGAIDLSRIFKNDKFVDEASTQKSWKILSVFDSQDKIIVYNSEGNGGSPSTGTSQATVGRWYTSISLWEAGRQGDITAAGRNAIERGLPYYDGSADTTAVVIDGWTTDSTHYIEIYVPLSERHRGVWDGGRYYMEMTNATAITVNENNVRIDGLQISLLGSTGNRAGIYSTSALSNIQISNNIIKDANLGGPRDGIQFIDTTSTNTNFKIWNNIIYDFGYGVSQGIYFRGAVAGAFVYNNTVYGNTVNNLNHCFAGSNAMIAKNNIAQGCNDGFNGTFNSASDYNISDIAGDTTGISPSYRSGLATTVPFVDSTNKDFHLEFRDGTGNPAMNAGADLTTDFTTDIDGDTRSGTWDIGADDVGATLVKVHSIGTATRNFATLQGWEDARDGVLTTRNVFKITTQSAAFTEGETITGTSGATGTYIKERDTPSASETYMTVDKGNATAFVAGETVTGTGGSTAVISTILTTAGTIERGEAYKDTTFTAGVTIDNSTTDATHYMWLTAEPRSRHRGVAGTGVKIKAQGTFTPYASLVGINNFYTIIEWMEVEGSNINGARGLSLTGNVSNNSIIRNNLMYNFGSNSFGIQVGFYGHEIGYVYNNVIYNSITGCIDALNYANISIYNNLTYNCSTGISRVGTNGTYPTLKNNLSVGNTTDYSGSFNAASSNNISSDATAPGANSLTNQTLSNIKFVSTTAGIEDFHLLPASIAKDAGTSLSPTFTTDIDDGQTRPVGSAWDIGADEWSPSGPIYNSSGTYTSTTLDTTTQNIISATLTKTDSAGTGTLAYELSNDGGTTYTSVTPGAPYTFTTTGSNLKARATFTSADLISTPSLDDVTVSYTYYPASQTLTSSAYNTSSAANIIGSLSWTEDTNLPAGTGVTVSLRAADSEANLTPVAWSDFTNATTNCSKL